MFHVGVVILLLFLQSTSAARDPEGFEDGNDLESFVTVCGVTSSIPVLLQLTQLLRDLI